MPKNIFCPKLPMVTPIRSPEKVLIIKYKKIQSVYFLQIPTLLPKQILSIEKKKVKQKTELLI